MEDEGGADDERRWKRDFGYRLRLLREAERLSQADLAHRSGLHPTYVSGIERGLRNVSLVNIHRLARALDVEPSGFFTQGHRVGEG